MIFVVEDEPTLRRSVADYLAAADHQVEAFGDAEGALAAAEKQPPDVAVCDLQLPGMNGLELIEKLTDVDPGIVRIAMTAHSSVQSAVRAMRAGCYEYLEKPVDLERLCRLIERALSEQRSALELAWHRRADSPGEASAGLTGESHQILAVRQQIETLAQIEGEGPPVLITGETGVGKGVVAKLVHDARFGGDAPWIDLNCAALPSTLIEAELFGYERSAFTDAKQAKPGLFEAATGGSIFLDEIGELAHDIQAKLLKVVESNAVRRLGGLRERPISAAIVAASNVDLKGAADDGSFRKDLYHRLAAFTIEIPPLRERGRDALLLAQHFLAELAPRYRKPLETISDTAAQRILDNPWPGNIRELRFAIERAVIVSAPSATVLQAEHLPAAESRAPSSEAPGVAASDDGIQIRLPKDGVSMAEVERAILAEALRITDGNVVAAARFLDLKRDAMRYRIKKFGLSTSPDPDDE